jgi:zinc transport system substrate-binding protein
VTSIYPLQFLAERITAGEVEVTNLTSPGQDSHDLELGIEQTAELAEAGVLVYLSGVQPAVDDAVEQNGPEHVVDAAEAADLRPIVGHDEDDGHEHDPGDGDPHFWLDPVRMADVAAAAEQSLAAAYPEHADAFATNLEELTTELKALDQAYRIGLRDCDTDAVVVSHEAFGYLAKYGLDLHAIAGLSPDAEPSPAHLAELQELIGEHGITTVFTEPLSGTQMADTLAADLGLRTAVLDPVEGLSDDTADEDYLSLMRSNLAALRAANGCR